MLPQKVQLRFTPRGKAEHPSLTTPPLPRPQGCYPLESTPTSTTSISVLDLERTGFPEKFS